MQEIDTVLYYRFTRRGGMSKSKKTMIPFDKIFHGSSKDTIINFEKQIGWDLPSDYREFLLKFNGGVLPLCLITIPHMNRDLGVHVLYGLNLNESFDLNFWREEWIDEMPEKSLLIGHDLSGNKFILNENGKDSGIYFYYFHRIELDPAAEIGELYKVAPDFHSFLQSIRLP